MLDDLVLASHVGIAPLEDVLGAGAAALDLGPVAADLLVAVDPVHEDALIWRGDAVIYDEASVEVEVSDPRGPGGTGFSVLDRGLGGLVVTVQEVPAVEVVDVRKVVPGGSCIGIGYRQEVRGAGLVQHHVNLNIVLGREVEEVYVNVLLEGLAVDQLAEYSAVGLVVQVLDIGSVESGLCGSNLLVCVNVDLNGSLRAECKRRQQ